MEVRKFPGLLFLLICMCSCLQDASGKLQFDILDTSKSESYKNGKEKMDELVQRSKMPVGTGPSGNCWKSVLDDLEIGCKFLTEEVQQRMALRFLSCFNAMFGKNLYVCENRTPIQNCLQQLTQPDIITFNTYFLHTKDMCYFLQYEVWQELTNDAVTRLSEAASDATIQMEEQKRIQEQIFQSQQESLMVQSNMKKDNEDLYNAVVKVKDVFDDFSVSTREHQAITTEIFDKLSRMQKLVSWIQGEMSLFDAVFFYFGIIVLGFFTTATTRTKAARFWLVILFIFSMYCEHAMLKYFTNRGTDFQPEEIQSNIWVMRKVMASVGCIIVILAAIFYRDPMEIQKSMIDSLNCSLNQLSQFVREDLPKHVASEMEDNDGSSSDDDTYDDYSSDSSVDNLEHELKSLREEAEDTENVNPDPISSPSMLSRYFGKETNEVTSTSPTITGMRRNHRYNLRERSATPKENPVLHEESVTQFAKLVKRRRTPKPKNSIPDPSNVPRSA